jgi:hypothetical protein
LVPKGSLHELSFVELESDPVGAMRRLYASLNLPAYETNLRPEVEAYVASHADYQKNTLPNLDPASKKLVQDRWGPSFAMFGYDK